MRSSTVEEVNHILSTLQAFFHNDAETYEAFPNVEMTTRNMGIPFYMDLEQGDSASPAHALLPMLLAPDRS